MQETTHKSEYIMLVNVLSMLAVVYMHVNNCFWTFSTERYWKSADVIESVMYFAVPCFFMISGANLMDYRKRYDTKTFLIKRTKKTIIPYILELVWHWLWYMDEYLTVGGCNYKICSQWFDKWLISKNFLVFHTVIYSLSFHTVVFGGRRRKT